MRGIGGLLVFVCVFVALMVFGGAINDPVTVKAAGIGAVLCLLGMLGLLVVNWRNR